MNFSQIYEGWKNKLIPSKHLKEQIKEVSEYRMEICKSCPLYSDNRKATGWKTKRPDVHCTNCGCTLSAKTACLSCECPKELWGSVLTNEEYEEIRNEIEENGE